MRAVDIVVLTRNSERLLTQCLQSVYDNVPVNRLIAIDAYSKDGTMKILEQFNRRYGNVQVIIKNGSRGKAREVGIREVETEWFAFIDSDIVLCEDWYEKAVRSVRDDVGAVWGVDVPGDLTSKFLVKGFEWMEARVFEIRGGCHDILIRYDAVRNISIPERLHTLEDAYIRDWIVSRGYKAVISYQAKCQHFKCMDNLFSKENRMSTISELKNINLVRERLIYAWFFACMWFLQETKTKNGRTFLHR